MTDWQRRDGGWERSPDDAYLRVFEGKPGDWGARVAWRDTKAEIAGTACRACFGEGEEGLRAAQEWAEQAAAYLRGLAAIGGGQ